MSINSKITELRPQVGGGGTVSGASCLIIEKTDNGYILRALGGSEDDAVLQECRVYIDRSELMRDIASRL